MKQKSPQESPRQKNDAIQALSKSGESLVRTLSSRHGRKKSDLCVVEGKKACAELLNLRPDLAEFAVVSDSFDENFFKNIQNVKIFRVSGAKFAELSSFQHAEGVLFVAKRPETDDAVPSSEEFHVLLDRISDPGNLGTIIRTARAIGMKCLWLTEGTADPFSPKVIRCALASQFGVRFRYFDSVSDAVREFRKNSAGVVYFTNPHSGANCFTEKELFDKSLIVFGNEASGATAPAGEKRLSIPMPGGIESINVAQAFTVIVFESVRRKSQI